MTREGRGPVRRLFRLGLGQPRPDEAVEWEIEHYLAERIDRLVAEGWEADAARREAERRFGESHGTKMTRIERRRRTMRTMSGWLGGVGEAVAGAARTLRRSPGFAAAVVLTLTLGIGANAAIFGILDRLLLQPPTHVEEADEVVQFAMQRPGWGDRLQTSLTYPDVRDFEAGRSFESVAGQSWVQDWTLEVGEDVRPVDGRMVSWDFFPLLGAEPRMGRFFGEDEDLPGEPLTAVLSQEFWESAFGADPGILGRTLEVGGHPATVIGVAPAGFTGIDLEAVDLWLPLDAAETAFTGGTEYQDARGWWWMSGVARLADGVTVEAAEDEATRLHRSGRQELIAEGRYQEGTRILLSGIVAGVAGRYQEEGRVVRWLAGVSLLVLLIACANVANLLLARGSRRRREVAVRLALGVSRARLVGQMILQTVLLALIGGALAVGLAAWGGDVLQRVLLPEVAFPDGGTGGRVLLFAFGVSLLAGVLAGVAPALQSTRADVAGDLKEGRRGSSGRSGVRGALATAQAAMSVVLLVGAGLFVQSLQQIRGLDLGLEVDELLLGSLEFDSESLTDQEKNDLYLRAVDQVARIPGISGAAATHAPFLYNYATSLEVPGLDSIPRMPGGGPYYYAVTPGYFETVGLTVQEGRTIEKGDRAGAQRVAWVSRSMADSLWAGEGALGQCLLIGSEPEGCTTVVGVVEEASRGGIQEDPFFGYYIPLAQAGQDAVGLYVRAADPEAVAPAVSRLLRTLSPEIRFARVQTLRDVLDPQARSWSLGATMFTLFGLLALVVAAVGLYSLLAFNVAERTREIGIRSALGAAKGRLLGSVVAEGTRLTLLGVVLGLGVAWVGAPYVRDLLFGVSPRDPLVLGGVAAVLLLVALGASALPGLRAVRIEPSEALRTE